MKDPTVGFVSLGCPKALVDSERILTTLRTDGYQVVANYDQADLVKSRKLIYDYEKFAQVLGLDDMQMIFVLMHQYALTVET